jgi:hypothetical protein
MSLLARLLLVSGCCLLLGGCSGTDSTPEPTQLPPASTVAHFAVLRTPSEVLPPKLAHHIGEIILGQGKKFEPHDTQQVLTPDGLAWVFLLNGTLCLSQPRHGSIGCTPSKVAVSRGAVIGTFSPPDHRHQALRHFRLLGIAPDGFRWALLVIGHHDQVWVKVHDNFFAMSAEQPVLLQKLAQRRS